MRYCLLIGIVWIAYAVTPSAVFSAAPVPHGESGHPAADGQGEGGKRVGVGEGLFKGAIELSLWSIIVFVVLLFVLQKFAWGPILEGLKKREEGIARDKEEAELARKEAAQMREQLKAEMARVNAEISEMIAKARRDAQATAAEELARGKAELQSERERLHRDMQMARDQALREIWSQGAQLATLISSKAIGKQLSYDDHRALLDEALGEFRSAGQARLAEIESARA